jgi:hypothetical protein
MADRADEPEIVIGSREQLLHLLAEASEIEHTLMCSYLYAAFSLKRGDDESLKGAESEASERWRAAIMDVAIQEMGHLLMVANLTVAVGGRPHFSRPNFPVSPGYFPAGVVVRLSGLSIDTLDHFIFLERPRGVDGDDPDEYDQRDYDRSQAQPGLMPSAQDYATIGHLYDAIRLNLTVLCQRLGEDGLFIGVRAGQLGSDVIDLEGVETIGTLAEALSAIELIVEQGEGSSSDREESHYRIFKTIREELEAMTAANAGFAPAWPVADNPVLRRPPEPEDKVFIAAPDAAQLLDFTCATYGTLLRVLVQAFARPGEDTALEQKQLMRTAFGLMHVLAAASDELARLPAARDAPGIHAGMSFTMLRGVEPLLFGEVEKCVLAEQLSALAAGAPNQPAGLREKMEDLVEGFIDADRGAAIA